MTREEAIKELNKPDENINYDEKWGVYFTSDWLAAYEMAIAALREQEKLESKLKVLESSGWIGVEERLPERRGHYFIAYKFADSDMRFYGEAMWHDDVPGNGYVQGNHFANEGLHGMRVTHWMEIPQLPEPPEVEG